MLTPSPATVLLFIIGGMNYVADFGVIPMSVILLVLVAIYVAICLLATQENQLLAAKIFTLIFAFIMGAVFIGVASEIASEFHNPSDSSDGTTTTTTSNPFGPHELAWNSSLYTPIVGGGAGIVPNSAISVSTIYLGSIIAMFLIAGLMHINEAMALIHGNGQLFPFPYHRTPLPFGMKLIPRNSVHPDASGWLSLLDHLQLLQSQ
jgi:hypothetical protein